MEVNNYEQTIKWYDENAEKYSNGAQMYDCTEEIEEFAELLPINAKILDAGCGSGRDTKVFADYGYECVGIDLSEGLIQQAKKRNVENNLVHGNMLSLPFKDKSFDGIWSHASLLHLPDIVSVKNVLKEYNRISKKDAILYISVKAQMGEKKTDVVSDSLSGHNRFFQYFTQQEMIELLKKSGYDLLDIEEYLESDKCPGGRNVGWIKILATKQRELS